MTTSWHFSRLVETSVGTETNLDKQSDCSEELIKLDTAMTYGCHQSKDDTDMAYSSPGWFPLLVILIMFKELKKM